MILDKRIPLAYWLKIIKWDLIFIPTFAVAAHYLTDHFLKLTIPLSIPAFLGLKINRIELMKILSPLSFLLGFIFLSSMINYC